MPRNPLFSCLVLCVTVAGTNPHLVASSFSGPDFGVVNNEKATLPLVEKESLIFLGVEGEFEEAKVEELETILAEQAELARVGEVISVATDKERQVWAVRGTDPESKLRKLIRPLKKAGFKATQLRVSAMSLLDRVSTRTVSRAVREMERSQRRFWTASFVAKESLLWAFHEKKFDASDCLKGLRELRLKATHHHQVIQLQTEEGADLQELASLAKEKLDLVRATKKEAALELDLYLRDLDSFLALPKNKKTYACPDVIPFLEKAQGARLDWKVTLENRGYPFAT